MKKTPNRHLSKCENELILCSAILVANSAYVYLMVVYLTLVFTVDTSLLDEVENIYDVMPVA